MDFEYEDQYKDLPLKLKPSEYWRRQCKATFQYDRVGTKLIDEMGVETLMWGSDYPHPDGVWPESEKYISEQFKHLPEDVTQQDDLRERRPVLRPDQVSDRTTPTTPTTTPRTAAEATLLETAARRLPGGVLGAARFADDLAFVVKRAQGSHLWDVSGREYIDYLLGSGPMFLGHSHPAVVRAVTEQLASGSTYFLVNEPAIALADEVCRAVPCGEQIRFTSTGAEATFFALRAARAFRKRDKILKFEGGYHGSHDYALMSQTPKSPKAFPAPMPDSGGIPHAIQDQVLVAPYNDLATVEALDRRARPRARRGDRRAVPATHPARDRVPRRAACDHAASRDPAHLRRGRHRLPLRLWRRAGALRRHAGPGRLRQDHRRRLPAGRGRRSRRHHAWLRSADGRHARLRLAVGHAQRQPHRRRGWAGLAGRAAQARRLRAGARPSAEASWPASPTW